MKLLLLLFTAWMLAAPAPAQIAPAVATVPDMRDGGAEAPVHDGPVHRDPFRPFILDLRRDQQVPLSPLQRYELGQLTVVATVWEVSPPRAVVEDSVGMGYIVTVGTPLGRNGGIVTAIESQRVVVEEHVVDYYGKDQVNRVVMETPKEEGPNQPGRERK